MDAQMWASIAGGLAEGVAGAILGILWTLLVVRLQRERYEVDWGIATGRLFDSRRTADTAQNLLTLVVDKSALTGDPNDAGSGEQVTEAYTGTISVHNTGNRTTPEFIVQAKLPGAQFVYFSTEPQSRPDYPITIDRTTLDSLYVRVPYLNVEERISITTIAVHKPDGTNKTVDFPDGWEVKVVGKGIKKRKVNRLLEQITSGLGGPLIAGITVAFAALPGLLLLLGYLITVFSR